MSSSKKVRSDPWKPESRSSVYRPEASRRHRESKKSQETVQIRGPAAFPRVEEVPSSKPIRNISNEDVYLIKALHDLRYDSWVIAASMLPFRVQQCLHEISAANREEDLHPLIFQSPSEIQGILDRFDEFEALVNQQPDRRFPHDYVKQGLDFILWFLMPRDETAARNLMKYWMRDFQEKYCIGKKEEWVDNLYAEYRRLELELYKMRNDGPESKMSIAR
ncbi:MAG: hypothetical protein LQ352_001937 [Teloschistes flavicans]|nr:MAG: hypothetical protein LQ352_001937 [Teloschistes flavicans]